MLVGILGPGLWTLDDASCGWGNGREVWAAFSYVEDLSLVDFPCWQNGTLFSLT